MINLKLTEKQSELLNIALSMAIGFANGTPTEENKNLVGDIENLIKYITYKLNQEHKCGAELIADERDRQIFKEGFTPDKDKDYVCGELTDAAVMYALRGYWKDRLPAEFVGSQDCPGWIWPFNASWYKPSPKDRIRDLQKAGALIAAEIDRLLNLKRNM